MNKKLKYALLFGIPVLVVTAFVIFIFFLLKKPKVVKPPTVEGVPEDVVQISREVRFTHDIFDTGKVKNIVPLGELNGGYIETQTINGVCVFNKTAEPLEIYAPADMTLKYYSYITAQGNEPANYQLTFALSDDFEMTFHHINTVADELRDAMPPTSTSGGVPPKKEITVKAGQFLARTSGTSGHNWNIYLSDKKHTNKFVNQERYEKIRDRYAFVTAVCPFQPFEEAKRAPYLALMGATAAGQSKTCGNPSKDVKGSISGLWHLSKEVDPMKMIMGEYAGDYATPFSIYKDSAGQIVIYEIGRKRYILGSENPTYKDPAVVTTEHCYSLSQYPGERRGGYAYFKVISDMEMKVAYSANESCPVSFPDASATSYYR